jgi:hypothetical protein
VRDYGKVYSTFWSSSTTSGLSDDGKLLALYLMTCSHSTIAGVFRLPDGYVSEDLGWPSERVRKGFAELFAKGFANRCETTKWVFVRKHLEWNKPENPNQRKSAAKIAAGIPRDCCWGPDFSSTYGDFLGIEEGEPWNPSGTLSEPLLNQEQEQEQEQKQEQEQEKKKEPRKRDPSPPPVVRPDGVSEGVWVDWLALRRKKSAPVTATVLQGAEAEAAKAGMTLDAFLRVWCMRGSQGLQAEWLKPAERQAFAARAQEIEPEWRRRERERNEAFLGPAAIRRTDPNTIEAQVRHITPDLLTGS